MPDAGQAALWAGASSAAFSVVMAVLGPFWGALADRHGPRLMVGRAMFGGAFVIGAMGLVRSVYGLFGLRVLQGAVTGVQAAITVLVAVDRPPPAPGRRASGSYRWPPSAGPRSGPCWAGIVADRFGFRPTFLITGALMLLSGVVVFAGVPERAAPGAARPGWAWSPGCAGPPPRPRC